MKLLNVIRLKSPRPDLGLTAEVEGTIVDVFSEGFLVEFSDDDGQEYAMPWLRREEVTLVWSAPDNTAVAPAPRRAAR